MKKIHSDIILLFIYNNIIALFTIIM